MDGAHTTEVAEVAGGPDGWVQLYGFPSHVASLPGEGGHEAVDGTGVLHVPQQLAAPPAGDVAPVWRTPFVQRRDAPPFPCQPHGGPVPAGQHGQAWVGEGEATARCGRANHKAEVLQGGDYLGRPRAGDAHQARQVVRLSHGQPESRSMARFSAGLSSAGRRYSGASSPGRYLSRSGGNEIRARGCSIGRTPPGGSLTMAASRSTAPLTEGSRHTGTSVAPDAASHSSARRAATGVRASACGRTAAASRRASA